MDTAYKVRLTPEFRHLVESWSSHDQDILFAFISELSEWGFDLICGSRVNSVDGLVAEFVEPGETPDMVWARVFLDLSSQCVVLRVYQHGHAIFLEAG